LVAVASQNAVLRLEASRSAAWSTERMPVLRKRSSGVGNVARGSSATICGTISGCANGSFTPAASSVQPALQLNSAADKVVGTATILAALGVGVTQLGSTAP
jgi:hypothetical protein